MVPRLSSIHSLTLAWGGIIRDKFFLASFGSSYTYLCYSTAERRQINKTTESSTHNKSTENTHTKRKYTSRINMETVTNIASAASNTVSRAIWGEQPETDAIKITQGNETGGEEPVSGKTGDVQAGEPYDLGNSGGELSFFLPSFLWLWVSLLGCSNVASRDFLRWILDYDYRSSI